MASSQLCVFALFALGNGDDWHWCATVSDELLLVVLGGVLYQLGWRIGVLDEVCGSFVWQRFFIIGLVDLLELFYVCLFEFEFEVDTAGAQHCWVKTTFIIGGDHKNASLRFFETVDQIEKDVERELSFHFSAHGRTLLFFIGVGIEHVRDRVFVAVESRKSVEDSVNNVAVWLSLASHEFEVAVFVSLHAVNIFDD